MLEAVGSEELIVGAYTDRHGRVCPMLAAHRRGARTGGGAFPRAWDSFAQAPRSGTMSVRPSAKRTLIASLLKVNFSARASAFVTREELMPFCA